MQEFLQIISSFPTIVFTVLMGFTLFFWGLVIAGGMGIDFFSFDVDVAAASEEAGSTVAEFLSVLGVGTIPFSITLTVFVFWGWTISFLTTYLAMQAMAVGPLMGFALLIGTTAVSMPLTGLVTSPMRKMFEGEQTDTSESIIGSVCKISTSRVDEEFGRAKCYHDGAELILNVRCDGADGLEKGDKALLIHHDEAEGVYWVEPYDSLTGESEDEAETELSFDDRLAEATDKVGADDEEKKEVKEEFVES